MYDGSVSQGSGLVIATIDGSRSPRVAVSGAFVSEGQFLPKRPSLLVLRSTDRGTKLAIANLDNGNLMPDLISEPGYGGKASASPDGQWLALVTDRSGRPEVVLARFVEDGARPLLNAQRLPVSSAGGVDPHWRADGHEIISRPHAAAASVMITAMRVDR